MINRSGVVVWEARYSAFGEAEIVTETVSNDLRFPGQYFDAESGLHHNYFRDYDPGMGRYVQADPIGLNGGLNRYGYARQNPNSLKDPRGKFYQPVIAVESIINALGLGIVLSQDSPNDDIPYNPVWEPIAGETHPTHDDEQTARECRDDDDCSELIWSIEVLTRQLQFRRYDMQRNGGRDLQRHIRHYNLIRNRLRQLIAQARSRLCFYTPQADIEVTRRWDFPTPRYNVGF